MNTDYDVDATGIEPYQVVPLTLAAGEIRRIATRNRYVALFSATDTTAVQISWRGASFQNFPSGILVMGYVSNQIWIKNTSLSSNTISLYIGQAEVRDSRLLLSALAALPVTIASGGVASGAFASGSVASGAFAAGSIGSGAMVDLGAKADAAATTDTGTFSLIALIKRFLAKFPPTVAYVVNSLATTNAALIATGARTVKSVQVFNASGAPVYVRLTDKATIPLPGTDIPFRIYAVPTVTTVNVVLPAGDAYTLGLGISITAGAAANDATAVGAGDAQVTVNYV